MRTHPASRPGPSARRVGLALLTLALASCGGDSAGSDAAGDEEVIEHLDGPGCEGAVRYEAPRPSGVGAPERARLGMGRVPVASAFEASLCSDFCHAAERCGDDLGGRTACLARCASLLADGRGNAVACYASDCRQRARCLDDGPVEAVAGCPELCAAVAACPALSILGLPAPPPKEVACGTVCAGRSVAAPSFGDAVPCLVNAAKACDLDEGLACLPHGGAFCPTLCLEVEACPAGSPLAGVWPNRDACFSECDARTPVMALKARACFERLGCAADRACTDETPPICAAYYAEVAKRCDAATSWPASFELLTETCDPTLLSSLESTDEVAACLDLRGACDDLESRVCPGLARAGDDRCALICSAMCDCGVMTAADCVGMCEEAREDDPELDTLAACAGEGDCDVLTTCADEVLAGSPLSAPAAGDDPCARYCRATADCDGAAALPGCLAACAARLDAGDPAPLGAIGCYEAGGCAAWSTCDATPQSAAVCAAACDGANVACGRVLAGFDAGLASCTAYCSGLVTTWASDDDAATAACVVEATGPRCALTDDADCAP